MIPLQVGCNPCNLAAGTYATSGQHAFLPGLQVTVPAGWFSDEQDAGEFNLHPVGQPDNSIFFWKDLVATTDDQAGTQLAGVSGSAPGILAWLTADPDLIVTKPRQTMIGQVPVVMVDVRVSHTAKTPKNSECHTDPCVWFLRDMKHWDGPFAIAQGDIARFYFGTIGQASDPHTFVVEIEGRGFDAPALDAFTQRVRPILDSVVIPAVIVPGGRLAYGRFGENGVTVFTANPDGSDEKVLLGPGNEGPRWAPGGQRLAVTVESPQGSIFVGLIDPDGSNLVRLDSPDHTLQLGCVAWSPDSARLACEGWDDMNPARNGIYSVRASDGGDLTRLTTNPSGGHDVLGDYSPDGRRIVYLRTTATDEEHDTLMVVNVEGSGATALTDQKVGLACRWSPDGSTILTEADGALLLVPVDGSPPRSIKIAADSAVTATRGGWSPDGTWIVFSRVSSDGEDIYVMKADGTGLSQVTHTPGQNEEFGDWGP